MTFVSGSGVRGRRYVFVGDLGDAGDRADDVVELAGEVVELFVGQLQTRQPGEVGDLVAGDRATGESADMSLQVDAAGTHSLGGGTDNL